MAMLLHGVLVILCISCLPAHAQQGEDDACMGVQASQPCSSSVLIQRNHLQSSQSKVSNPATDFGFPLWFSESAASGEEETTRLVAPFSEDALEAPKQEEAQRNIHAFDSFGAHDYILETPVIQGSSHSKKANKTKDDDEQATQSLRLDYIGSAREEATPKEKADREAADRNEKEAKREAADQAEKKNPEKEKAEENNVGKEKAEKDKVEKTKDKGQSHEGEIFGFMQDGREPASLLAVPATPEAQVGPKDEQLPNPEDNKDLNEDGLRKVVKLRNVDEVFSFLHRLTEAIGLEPKSTKGDDFLYKMATEYATAGKADEFDVLVKKLLESKHLEPTIIVKNASVAPLSQNGYRGVVQQQSNAEMQKYMTRLAESMDLKITNKGGLAGTAPWYSGKKAVQTLEKLRAELTAQSRKKDGWVAQRDGKKPADSLLALSSSVERQIQSGADASAKEEPTGTKNASGTKLANTMPNASEAPDWKLNVSRREGRNAHTESNESNKSLPETAEEIVKSLHAKALKKNTTVAAKAKANSTSNTSSKVTTKAGNVTASTKKTAATVKTNKTAANSSTAVNKTGLDKTNKTTTNSSKVIKTAKSVSATNKSGNVTSAGKVTEAAKTNKTTTNSSKAVAKKASNATGTGAVNKTTAVKTNSTATMKTAAAKTNKTTTNSSQAVEKKASNATGTGAVNKTTAVKKTNSTATMKTAAAKTNKTTTNSSKAVAKKESNATGTGAANKTTAVKKTNSTATMKTASAKTNKTTTNSSTAKMNKTATNSTSVAAKVDKTKPASINIKPTKSTKLTLNATGAATTNGTAGTTSKVLTNSSTAATTDRVFVSRSADSAPTVTTNTSIANTTTTKRNVSAGSSNQTLLKSKVATNSTTTRSPVAASSNQTLVRSNSTKVASSSNQTLVRSNSTKVASNVTVSKNVTAGSVNRTLVVGNSSKAVTNRTLTNSSTVKSNTTAVKSNTTAVKSNTTAVKSNTTAVKSNTTAVKSSTKPAASSSSKPSKTVKKDSKVTKALGGDAPTAEEVNAAKKDDEETEDAAPIIHMFFDFKALGEAEWKKVAKRKDTSEMYSFINQTVIALGLKEDEDGYLDKLTVKKSKAAKPISFADLVIELLNEKGEALAATCIERNGTTAPLSENGYRAVAQTQDDKQMQEYAKRVANEISLDVDSEGGLQGAVPYYNGKKAVQSLNKLREEMRKVATQSDGWVTRRGTVNMNSTSDMAENSSSDMAGNSTSEIPVDDMEVGTSTDRAASADITGSALGAPR